MCTAIDCALDHERFCTRGTYDGRCTGRCNSANRVIHFLIVDITVFTVYHHALKKWWDYQPGLVYRVTFSPKDTSDRIRDMATGYRHLHQDHRRALPKNIPETTARGRCKVPHHSWRARELSAGVSCRWRKQWRTERENQGWDLNPSREIAETSDQIGRNDQWPANAAMLRGCSD